MSSPTPDGTRTSLHYKQGKPFGRVQVVWPNGEKLDGEIDENQRLHGVRSSPDGSKYEGDLKNYMPDGKGSFIRADGLRYKGDFVAGKIEGEGEMLFSDGGLYQGSFATASRTAAARCVRRTARSIAALGSTAV